MPEQAIKSTEPLIGVRVYFASHNFNGAVRSGVVIGLEDNGRTALVQIKRFGKTEVVKMPALALI